MFKNQASQKIEVLVVDTAANVPKTGDAANLTLYVSKDDGTLTALTDTSATEVSSTNAPGVYLFDLTQAETNADKLLFTGKSSTTDVRVIPRVVYTNQQTSNGHGAYACTWTVNDGSTVLQSAVVRFDNGAGTIATAVTNSSGQVSMSLDAATWTVSITKGGYSFTPTTHVVSSTSSTWTATFSMTAEVTTPDPDPAKSVTTIVCYGTDTLVEQGVTIYVRQISVPPNDEDHVFDGSTAEYTSDSNGEIDLTLWRHAKYQLKRGNSGWVEYTPRAATDSIQSFSGRDIDA